MASHEHGEHHHHGHHHDHVRLDEADWQAMAAHTELQGELFLPFVTGTVARIHELRGDTMPTVSRVLDVGSGPGVAACELARLFPDARVVAIDSSAAMLERATQRAAKLSLGDRVSVYLAELPDGLGGVEPAELIWASMSLHHVGDQVAALRALRGLLTADGVIAIAEIADPLRVLPDDLGFGRLGLAERLNRAGAAWFATMRDGLDGAVPGASVAEMLTTAGFTVIDQRIVREHLSAPLSDDARQVVLGHLRRACEQFAGQLDVDDVETLTILGDEHDPRCVLHRDDVFFEGSSDIVIATC